MKDAESAVIERHVNFYYRDAKMSTLEKDALQTLHPPLPHIENEKGNRLELAQIFTIVSRK